MKTLKPYHGIILLLLSLAVLLGISPILGARFGLYGSFMGEVLFLIFAVGIVLIAKGSLKQVFPIHKIRFTQLFGSFLLWAATMLAGTIITLVLSYFFPEEVFGISQGLGTAFVSVPFLVSFFIVAVTPAICEEAVFRGVILNSFRPFHNKWIIIIVSGVIFGAFHGSIWRFFPTALLGIMFSYIVMETGNLMYSVIFHGVNNGFAIILLYLTQGILRASGMAGISNMQLATIPLASVGSYLVLGGMIPFAVYIGNYLIHRGQAGYRLHLFTREKSLTIVVLALLTAMTVISGFGIIMYGLITEPEVFQNVLEQVS